MSAGEEDISVNQVCEQSDFVQKANRLIGLIKKSFEFLNAPSSVTNLIHQSSLSSF